METKEKRRFGRQFSIAWLFGITLNIAVALWLLRLGMATEKLGFYVSAVLALFPTFGGLAGFCFWGRDGFLFGATVGFLVGFSVFRFCLLAEIGSSWSWFW